MTLCLEFRLILYSDYHIGAGYGRGASIDSALQRDRDGVPVIRGTTLTGLLRDGLQQLAKLSPLQGKLKAPPPPGSTQPSTQSNRTAQLADQLFGAPQMPKRWDISSARPVTLMASQVPAQVEGAHAAAHVRVHPATRRAQARKLFIREEADQRWEFTFTAECANLSADSLKEGALLTAAARMVEHLGAGRRRGRGRCAIRLEQIVGWIPPGESKSHQDAFLQLFDEWWLQEKSVPTLQVEPLGLQIDHTIVTPDQSRRFLLLVRSDEPVLLAKRAEAGNQFETLDYIPGFVLRGALARMAAQRCQLNQQKPDEYKEFVRLFYRDGLLCSNLLPAQYAERSMYPTILAPEDLFFNEQHPKDKQLNDDGYTPLSAQQAAQNDFKEPSKADSLKLEPAAGRFVVVKQDAQFHRTDHCDEMHVTIDERTGRALDANLFGYVALAAGQYFMGEIVCKDAHDWHNLRRLAGLPELLEESSANERRHSKPFHLRFGKAQRRGYGKVSVVLMEAPAQDPWRALPLAQRFSDLTQPFTLTLLSDAIIIDAWGRTQQGFSETWLREILGFPVEIEKVHGQLDLQTGVGTEYPLTFAQPRLIDTFNNHFGLPRTRDLALRAGSAVTVRVTDEHCSLPEILQRLEALEANGIGLRRNEGFGRVVINHPVYHDACAGVDHNDQFAPESLGRRDDFGKTHIGREAKWRQDFLKNLEDQGEKLAILQHSEFDGLVRELASGQIDSLTAAEQLLQRYGSPEKDELFAKDQLHRQKPNPFAAGQKFSKGVELLRSLFKLLEALVSSDESAKATERWRIGSQMLADRIRAQIANGEER